jgi:hypothetical protein
MKIDIQTGEENQILRSISTEVKKEELSEVLVTGRAMVKWLKAKNNGA